MNKKLKAALYTLLTLVLVSLFFYLLYTESVAAIGFIVGVSVIYTVFTVVKLIYWFVYNLLD